MSKHTQSSRGLIGWGCWMGSQYWCMAWQSMRQVWNSSGNGEFLSSSARHRMSFFSRSFQIWSCLEAIGNVALGNDSPLTAQGDLLDEVQVCQLAFVASGLMPFTAWSQRLPPLYFDWEINEGSIAVTGVGDLMAVRDNWTLLAQKGSRDLSMHDVEFVMVGGHVQLASETMHGTASGSCHCKAWNLCGSTGRSDGCGHR